MMRCFVVCSNSLRGLFLIFNFSVSQYRLPLSTLPSMMVWVVLEAFDSILGLCPNCSDGVRVGIWRVYRAMYKVWAFI
jgi:hypothetical protein